MVSKHAKKAKPERNRMTVIGIVFFWMGIMFVSLSLMIFFISGGSWPEDYILPFFILVIGASVGLIFTLIGAILYFVGRSQGKREKNQNSRLV